MSQTISIVIPCYNAAPYVGKAIDSALKQTQPPLEIVLIDDGSMDGSAEIGEGFGKSVRVIRQKNRGAAAARNRGLEEIMGDYVLFLDADDFLAENALKHLSGAVAGRFDAVAYMGMAWFIDDPKSPHFIQRADQISFVPAILRECLFQPDSVLLPTPLVRDCGGFDVSLGLYEDWDLWARLALVGAQIIPVDYVGAFYRRHPDSQSNRATETERAGYYVRQMNEFCKAFLEGNPYLMAFGEDLFWSAISTATWAQRVGVTGGKLAELEGSIKKLVDSGSVKLSRASGFSQSIRLFGYQKARQILGIVLWAKELLGRITRGGSPKTKV
jgi:glycosyltransferase involved in cell wall biosynthesis